MTVTYESYRKARAEYELTPAHIVIEWIRLQQKSDAKYANVVSQGTFFYRGFTIDATLETDTGYADIEALGVFNDAPSAEAIVNPKWRFGKPWTYKYFHPATPLSDHLEAFRSMGVGKHDAWVRARRCVFEDCTTAFGDNAVIITVCASLCGVVLARQSLGGITADNDDDPYLREIVIDLLEDVVTIANRKAQEIVSVYVAQ